MKLFGGASHSFREPEAHDRVALTPRRYNPFPESDPGTSLGAAARGRPPRPDGAPLLQWLCGVPCAGADGHKSWLTCRSEERRVGKECRGRWWPYELTERRSAAAF